MELTTVLAALRKAWWLVLAAAVLGLAGAATVNATSQAQYQASVQQFVSIADSSGSDSNILSGAQFTLQRVKSYTQIATSAQVLGPVIDQLKLPYTVGDLAGETTASNPLDTVLIQLTVTDHDPARAAAMANAISLQLGKVVQDIERPQGGGPPPVKLSVTQPATVPVVPVSPRKSLNLALGLLVGLALGVGAALLREQLNTTVKSVDDLETLTGNVPLGLVPFDATAKDSPLVTANQSGSRAEAFRTLRTNLQFADVDNPPRSIVVTSPLPAEGKSTSACNIALTLALNGSRVVLVEADLRKPRVCAYLGLDNAVGLTNVLAGQNAVDDVLVPYNRSTMWVLPSGPVPPNPSELLGSHNMVLLLKELTERCDYVVLDAPPLLPVTDAAVLSTVADGAVLVVRYGKTHRDEVERAVQLLGTVNARMLGTVLNFIPQPRTILGKRYGYGYGYGYGDQTYGDAPSRPPSERRARAQARARAERHGDRRTAGRGASPTTGSIKASELDALFSGRPPSQ